MHALMDAGKRTLEKRAFIAGKPSREQTEIQESREAYVISVTERGTLPAARQLRTTRS
jgi:hypothetical protein